MNGPGRGPGGGLLRARGTLVGRGKISNRGCDASNVREAVSRCFEEAAGRALFWALRCSVTWSTLRVSTREVELLDR